MQNKQRKRTPEDTIIGVKPVEEALLAGKSIDKVLMQRGLQGDAVRKLRTALRERRSVYFASASERQAAALASLQK